MAGDALASVFVLWGFVVGAAGGAFARFGDVKRRDPRAGKSFDFVSQSVGLRVFRRSKWCKFAKLSAGKTLSLDWQISDFEDAAKTAKTAKTKKCPPEILFLKLSGGHFYFARFFSLRLRTKFSIDRIFSPNIGVFCGVLAHRVWK